MKFIEVKNYLDGLYPPENSFSWDNDGVEVCSGENEEINGILLCLDVTPDVADYAIQNGFQLIISHHPLLYAPVKKLTCSSAEIKTGLKLYKNNISAISFHTRLDSAVNGVNSAFITASKLYSLAVNIVSFGNAENDSIGRIIEFEKEIPVMELALYIKNNLSENLNESNFNAEFSFKYIDAKKPVKKAALVAGSGLMFLEDAVRVGIDTFITGEASYNKLISAAGMENNQGEKINFILCNHFESEVIVLPMLKFIIQKEFKDLKVDIHTENIIKELR